MRQVLRVLGGLLALAACAACSVRSDAQLQRTFDAATLALRQGNLVEAESLAERGLAQSNPESPWSWSFRFLSAEVLIDQVRLTDATALISPPLPPGAPFHALRARQKYLEGRVQVTSGRLPEAFRTLEQAQRLAPTDGAVRLDVDVLTGQVALRLGRWDAGESLLTSVVARAERSGDRFHHIWALNDLGMSRLVRSRWDEALPWFERVLSFENLDQYTKYAAALNNAGMCYARLGDFQRAVAIQQRAVEIQKRRGLRSDFQQALGELGGTYVLQGDLSRGLPYIREAFTVANEANLAGDAALWARNLAETYMDLGQISDADRFNTEAKRLTPPELAHKLVWSTLTDGRIAAGRGFSDEAARLFTEAITRSDREISVRWAAHAGFANLKLAQKQPDEAARHFEAALDVIEKNRSDLLKTEYKLSFLSRLISFYQDYVDALVDQGRLDRALEVSDSSRGRVLAERQGVTAPVRGRAVDFQRLAKRSGAVLLSYWLAPTRSYVWIVTPDAVRSLPLPPAKELEALVREHQATIDNTLADSLAARETAGDKLYRLLIEPVARWIPPGASLVIVPDGALHRLNFETLPVGGATRHYWIDDVEIQIAPSLAMAAASPASPATAPSLLLIGDPMPRLPDFPALSYASAEMANVSRHFASGRVATYKREQASPVAFRGAGPERYTMIHFTAHATANTESPLDSAIILSGPEREFKLYARDVASLPLHAELVTVSACRSAGERTYSGEGLVGFAWAFLRTGTRRVVAGLWDVDDRSTAELMDRFYERLAAGASPAGALRDAKRALIARGGGSAKPYYWAPFQLFTVSP